MILVTVLWIPVDRVVALPTGINLSDECDRVAIIICVIAGQILRQSLRFALSKHECDFDRMMVAVARM